MRVAITTITIPITPIKIALTIDSERIGTILPSIRLAWVRADGIKHVPYLTKGAEILGPLEDLLAYQVAPAKKATATKEKAKAAAETTAATSGQQPA